MSSEPFRHAINEIEGALATGRTKGADFSTQDVEVRPKQAYHETHEAPHCPTCECGEAKAAAVPDAWQARMFLGGKWGNWSATDAPDDPSELEIHFAGSKALRQYRPLYAARAKPAVEPGDEALRAAMLKECTQDSDTDMRGFVVGWNAYREAMLAPHPPAPATELTHLWAEEYAPPKTEPAVDRESAFCDAVVAALKSDSNDLRKEARILRAFRELSAPAVDSFQARVQPWMMECFGEEISKDIRERGDRLLEEVLELLQAHGYDPARVGTLRDYVFGRPVGEPKQEAGGVMVTLAAFCLAAGLNMHECGEVELARIWTMVEKIRAKQETKRGLHTPLPVPPPTVTGNPVSETNQELAEASQPDELSEWKARALEAEDLNQKLMDEINGPVFMGEPVLPPADNERPANPCDFSDSQWEEFDR